MKKIAIIVAAIIILGIPVLISILAKIDKTGEETITITKAVEPKTYILHSKGMELMVFPLDMPNGVDKDDRVLNMIKEDQQTNLKRFFAVYYPKLKGDWYDSAGNLVVRIEDNKINNIPILGEYLAGGSSSGRGEILVGNLSEHTPDHPTAGFLGVEFRFYSEAPKMDELRINDQELNRKQEIHRKLTVNGLGVKMTERQIIEKFGKDYVNELPKPFNSSGIYYPKLKLGVTTKGDLVYEIIIFKGSKVKFDKINLGYDNSVMEYGEALDLDKETTKDLPEIYGGWVSSAEMLGIFKEEGYIIVTIPEFYDTPRPISRKWDEKRSGSK